MALPFPSGFPLSQFRAILCLENCCPSLVKGEFGTRINGYRRLFVPLRSGALNNIAPSLVLIVDLGTHSLLALRVAVPSPKERASYSTLSSYPSMSFNALPKILKSKKGEFTSAFLYRLAKFEALFKFCGTFALIAKSLQINFSCYYQFNT